MQTFSGEMMALALSALLFNPVFADQADTPSVVKESDVTEGTLMLNTGEKVRLKY